VVGLIAKGVVVLHVAVTLWGLFIGLGVVPCVLQLESTLAVIALLYTSAMPSTWHNPTVWVVFCTISINILNPLGTAASFAHRLTSAGNDKAALRSLVAQSPMFYQFKKVLGMVLAQTSRFLVIGDSLALDTSTNWEGLTVYKAEKGNSAALPVSSPDYCNTVVDVGAAEGVLGSNSFLWAQLGYNIVLAEPEPRHQETIANNVLRYFPKVKLVKTAVSNFSGHGTFYRIKDNTLTTGTMQVLKENRKVDTSFTVEIKSYKQLILENVRPMCEGKDTYFLLTVDVEGHEEPVLQQISSTIPRPKYIIYEWSDVLKFYNIPGYYEVARNVNNVILKKK
jgi:FkbM family methyltransferase